IQERRQDAAFRRAMAPRRRQVQVSAGDRRQLAGASDPRSRQAQADRVTSALLRLEEVSKSFGALKVVDRLSLSLHPGEALGVLGPNGAGKSTVFNLIAGLLAPDAGRIVYNEQDITAMPAAGRCRLGIGRSFQIPHP